MLEVALVPVVSSLGPAMPMVAVRLVACLTPGERPVQGLGKVGVLAHPGEQRREGIEVGAVVDDRRARLHLRRPEAGRAAGDGEPGVDGEVLAHPEVGDEDLLVLAHESQPRPAGVRRVRDVQRGEQDVHRAEVPVHELGPVHRGQRGRELPGQHQHLGGEAVHPSARSSRTRCANVPRSACVPCRASGRFSASGKLGVPGSARPRCTSRGRFQERASWGRVVLNPDRKSSL